MKNIKDISIVAKLVSINTILMLLVLSVITVFIFIHEKTQYFAALQSNGELIAESIANNAALPILARNKDLMKEMLAASMRFENVGHISVYDKNKDLLVWVPDDSSPPAKEELSLQSEAAQLQSLQGESGFVEIFIPVYMGRRIGSSAEDLGFVEDILFAEDDDGELAGYVFLAMSTSGLKQRMANFAVKLTLSVFILALIGIALITAVARRFTRPVVELSRQAKRIAMGELDLSVNVASHDEIGDLGESFNYMVDSLRAMIAEVKDRADEVESLFEGARDGIFILDESFTIVKANKEFALSLDYEREELLGRSFLDLIEKPLDERLIPIFSSKDKPVIRQIDIKALSGEKLSFEVNFMPIVTASTKGLLCFSRDISERREMEAQLLNSERLAATGRLAADIAHEVNNPLGIIKNYISILEKEMQIGVDKEEIICNIGVVGSEIDRIADIIRGLLSFARPEVKGFSDTDLNKTIRQLEALMEGPLRKKEIILKLNLDEKIKSVHMSDGHIKQVLINLLKNSEDAMSAGGLLSIKTSKVLGGVELLIEDEGVGIEVDTVDQLMTPFYTTKGVKGTGLGLSVSYGILKSYGASLLLESRVEGGARARIFIPQRKEVL